MASRALLRVGVLGTLVAALCCFTPVLVVVLGVLGLSAAIGWLDYVLLPALGAFAAVSVYAWVRLRGEVARDGDSAPPQQIR